MVAPCAWCFFQRGTSLTWSYQSLANVTHLEIDEHAQGQRLDNFLRTALKGVPKTRLYRLIRKGEVRVNKGRIKPEYKLQIGDVVRIPPVRMDESEVIHQVSSQLERVLQDAVLYEDEHLLIVNKPAGLAVHGGSGVKSGLIEALRVIRPEERSLELVHRLDRDTSGCVMIAKKRAMLKLLHQQLRQNLVDKRYWALVVGRWPKSRQEVRTGLLKHSLVSGERMVKSDPEGKASLTKYAVLKHFQGYTLVEAKPVTGRTHQIRVHCQYAGNPILGDTKYGVEDANKAFKNNGFGRLFLHAKSLSLNLPDRAKPLFVEAPLGAQLEGCLRRLEAV